VSAASSGDTVIVVTALEAGYDFRINPIDTAMDTTLLFASFDSSSRSGDTIFLGRCYGFSAMQASATLDDANSGGAGNSDSAIITWFTEKDGTLYLMHADTSASAPFTSLFPVLRAIGDTLLREGLAVSWWLKDTCTDTTYTDSVAFRWDVKLK